MVARSTWFRAWLDKKGFVAGQGEGNAGAAHHGPQSAPRHALNSDVEQDYDYDDIEEYYLGRSGGRRNAFGNKPSGPKSNVRARTRLAAMSDRPKGFVSADRDE